MMWGLLLIVLAADPIIIPQIGDPSPSIDGEFHEWGQRGALRELKNARQVTFKPDGWGELKDLSGWVRFGHDEEFLYLAAHIVDDHVIQDQSGRGMWRGDHVMLTVAASRDSQIEQVVQCGISPGNFAKTGDASFVIKPEIVIWRPAGLPIEGASVAAVRRADGYDIEAAIPWASLGIKAAPYARFAMQLGFSDCDTRPATQEMVMSISTAKWAARDAKRLTPTGLGDRTGHFPADGFQDSIELAKDARLKIGETKTCTFNIDSIPEGCTPTLTFRSRIEHAHVAGCSGPLLTRVNGKLITKNNIANRPASMTTVNGRTFSAWYANGVRLWFAPSFEAIEQSPIKPIGVVAAEYVLRLDGMVRPGENTITFSNVDKRPGLEVVMANIAFGWWSSNRFPPPKQWKPAPTGELPVYEPRTDHEVDYQVQALPGGRLRVTWLDQELVFTSRFSMPDGKWTQHGTAGDLRIERTIYELDECILVRDTISNESPNRDRPLIIEHQTHVASPKSLWLGGRPVPVKTGVASVPPNPSVILLHDDSGIGMIAHDDVFRIHHRALFDGKTMKLRDDSLVLRPGVTYEHEWLIMPLARADYWAYVNAARRYFGTNFIIPGSFVFMSDRAATTDDGKLRERAALAAYLDVKHANLVSVGFSETYKGAWPHGPYRIGLDPSRLRTTNDLVRSVRPQAGLLSYFNCFNCARIKGDPVLWPECRVLLPDGEQVGRVSKLYFPTPDNAYGKEMDRYIDWILNTVGADGVYWDCYNLDRISHHGEAWDGWTGEIDPNTHALRKKKSNLALLAQPWVEKTTARLLKEGRPLVANGAPIFTSAYKFQFPRFVETSGISSVARTHLYTPIALGDHITERNEVDCYRWMLNALNWGGLYYWYAARIVPTRSTLTTHMFPFTPIELHSGYLIGRERILTNRSGLFGWGDLSGFKAHVYDRIGRETDGIDAVRVVRDGRAYAEVRIPEGYSAALVRQ